MKRLRLLLSPSTIRQFLNYLVMGGVATAVDWGSFYLLNQACHVHYRLSLIGSFSLGSLASFWLNKYYTFADPTRQLATQLAVFTLLALASFTCSCGLMALQVDVLGVHAMIARMVTTGVMLIANFLLNKRITFNPRWFSGAKAKAPQIGVGMAIAGFGADELKTGHKY
jgi:putative flippase GtrA